MQTKKLHELIEMAQNGKKFKAIHPKNNSVWEDKEFIQCETYNYTSIILDWQYEEIREPEVVEFECSFFPDATDKFIIPCGQGLDNILKPMVAKKWKVVCTEVME